MQLYIFYLLTVFFYLSKANVTSTVWLLTTEIDIIRYIISDF